MRTTMPDLRSDADVSIRLTIEGLWIEVAGLELQASLQHSTSAGMGTPRALHCVGSQQGGQLRCTYELKPRSASSSMEKPVVTPSLVSFLRYLVMSSSSPGGSSNFFAGLPSLLAARMSWI